MDFTSVLHIGRLGVRIIKHFIEKLDKTPLEDKRLKALAGRTKKKLWPIGVAYIIANNGLLLPKSKQNSILNENQLKVALKCLTILAAAEISLAPEASKVIEYLKKIG